MNTIQFFLEQQAFTKSVVNDMVYAGLSDPQLRTAPYEGQNSLIWLLWHTARWEDLIVTVLSDSKQVFDEADWLTRMNITRSDAGTAMTSEECSAFNTQVNIDGVQAYWEAVSNRTCDAVQLLNPETLRDVVTTARLRPAFDGGMIGSERARWVEGWPANHTTSWFLTFLILHRAEHLLGEALSVRGQGGFSPGL